MATMKQKMVVDKMLENGGNASKAMIDAGYSKAMAKNPQKVTKSDGFRELMEKALPNKHLLEKHREFLDTPRKVRTFIKGDLTNEIEETDQAAVKALDMAYKLKGSYAPDKNVNLNIDANTEELRIEIKQTLELLRTQR